MGGLELSPGGEDFSRKSRKLAKQKVYELKK